MMEISQTTTFTKQTKKLHDNQKQDLKNAIREVIINPRLGEAKKGDLSSIRVFKFPMVNQLTLLAYEWYPDEEILILISLGSHENFYKKLKN